MGKGGPLVGRTERGDGHGTEVPHPPAATLTATTTAAQVVDVDNNSSSNVVEVRVAEALVGRINLRFLDAKTGEVGSEAGQVVPDPEAGEVGAGWGCVWGGGWRSEAGQVVLDAKAGEVGAGQHAQQQGVAWGDTGSRTAGVCVAVCLAWTKAGEVGGERGEWRAAGWDPGSVGAARCAGRHGSCLQRRGDGVAATPSCWAGAGGTRDCRERRGREGTAQPATDGVLAGSTASQVREEGRDPPAPPDASAWPLPCPAPHPQVREEGRTRPDVILRNLTIRPGQVYSLRQAENDINAIYSLGLFEDVSIRPLPAEGSTDDNPKVGL